MIGKAILSLVVLCLMVGVVSADTLVIYPANPANGALENTTDGTILNMRNGIGDTFSNTSAGTVPIGVRATTTDSVWSQLSRGAYSINTTLPSGSTINSANLTIWVQTEYLTAGASSYTVTPFTPSSDTVLLASDYTTFGNTILAANISNAEFGSGQYIVFNFNAAGLSYIDDAGYTTVMVRLAQDIDNTTSGLTWGSGYRAEIATYTTPYTGTDKDPFFTIDYTPAAPPDTTPPASITNLVNDTYECNLVNWSWTNPADADFDLVQIYQNGTFLHNVTTAYDNWTGLAELTEYEIATHTCDATGNCNSTFVNATFTTISCPGAVIPVASFVSNVTCGNVPFAVRFNDTSLNVPTSWNWSFGDGNFSEDQNVTFTYTSAGLFSINFNATNEAGTGWNNVTDYIRAVPDWYTCPVIVTSTPWQPEIMPNTEFDARLDNLIPYWWIPAILLVGWVLFRKG